MVTITKDDTLNMAHNTYVKMFEIETVIQKLRGELIDMSTQLPRDSWAQRYCDAAIDSVRHSGRELHHAMNQINKTRYNI